VSRAVTSKAVSFFIIMENLEWYPFFYNGIETNVEVTKCGKIRKIPKYWLLRLKSIGEVDFNKLKIDNGYKRLTVKLKGSKPKTTRLHQILAAVFLGYEFNGYKTVVDHIDSNPLNNNINNLRVITQRENCSKEKTIKSGLPVGVSFDKSRNKFRSCLWIGNTPIVLGRFNTPEEASQAYQQKLKDIS
jgi:hypothetical protein